MSRPTLVIGLGGSMAARAYACSSMGYVHIKPHRASYGICGELPDDIELCPDEMFDLIRNKLNEVSTQDQHASLTSTNPDIHKRVIAAAESAEPDTRADAFEELLPAIMDLSKQEFQQLWVRLLDVLASRSREDILSDITVLAPAIAYFGGEEAIREVTRAIQDVTRWWP